MASTAVSTALLVSSTDIAAVDIGCPAEKLQSFVVPAGKMQGITSVASTAESTTLLVSSTDIAAVFPAEKLQSLVVLVRAFVAGLPASIWFLIYDPVLPSDCF